MSRLSRRTLVKSLFAVAGLSVVSACAGAPAAVATKPAATTAPAAATTAPAATIAPAAVATKPAEATKPAAATTAAGSPTAAAKPTGSAGSPTAAAAAASGAAIDRIKKNGKLVVLMDATFKPMEYKDEKGEIVGADVDFATELAKDLGVKLEVSNVNWDAIFVSLQANKGDLIISSVTITDERKKEMLFSEPYYTAGQVIAVKNDNTTIKGPGDLKGVVVGVQIDTTGQIAAEAIPGIKELKKYDGGADTMVALDTGRVEAVVMDIMVAMSYAAEHNTIKIVTPTPFVREDIGVAINKSNADLQTFVNQSIVKMKADGRLDAAFKKHGLK